MSAVLRRLDGGSINLELDRWHGEVDEVEWAILDGIAGPVLDIGCGPGRIAAALAQTGCPTLGIDPEPWAAAHARTRGATVLQRSVFDRLPGEGRWKSALLFDGNIGIGGDPLRLMCRVVELLSSGGITLVEVLDPSLPSELLTVRVEAIGDKCAGPWFQWAQVSACDFASLAQEAGFQDQRVVELSGRWFGMAVKP